MVADGPASAGEARIRSSRHGCHREVGDYLKSRPAARNGKHTRLDRPEPTRPNCRSDLFALADPTVKRLPISPPSRPSHDGRAGVESQWRRSGRPPRHARGAGPTVLLPLDAYVDLGVGLRNDDSTRTWDRRYEDQRRVAIADPERSGGDSVDLIAAPGESRDDLSEGAEARQPRARTDRPGYRRPPVSTPAARAAVTT